MIKKKQIFPLAEIQFHKSLINKKLFFSCNSNK